MSNEQFTWLTPFSQRDKPELTWHTRGHKPSPCKDTHCSSATGAIWDGVELIRPSARPMEFHAFPSRRAGGCGKDAIGSPGV